MVILLALLLPAGSSGLPARLPRHRTLAGDPMGHRIDGTYLALLRGEIAAFHVILLTSLVRKTTRLCGSNPPLAGGGCYPLRCPMEFGLSSPPRRLTRESDHLACSHR